MKLHGRFQPQSGISPLENLQKKKKIINNVGTSIIVESLSPKTLWSKRKEKTKI